MWPEEVSPFKVHLIELSSDSKNVGKDARAVYEDLQKKGVSVLYDERNDISAGEKFSDADLIGIPYRAVVSGKSLSGGGVELKKRGEEKTKIVSPAKLPSIFK